MTQWKINPDGVQNLLEGMAPDVEELYKAIDEDKFGYIFEGLTWGSVLTEEVPEAVQRLLEDQQGHLSTITNRVTASQLGVFNAVYSYNNGQEDMAGNFHNEMLSSAEDGNFDYFTEHGYQGEG